MSRQNPIGVFDSGMGGLTVLRALKEVLPNEEFIYLGDTARLPYGTKSRETVIHYALQNTRLLVDQRIKLLVVACNTVSAVALPELRQYFPGIPIIGVLEPGARAAVAATQTQRIAVLATEATISAGGYQKAINALNKNAIIATVSCSVLVALAEEGWVDNAVAHAAVTTYLQPILNSAECYDCLVLGCTHFPVFRAMFQECVKNKLKIIDSAEATAQVVVNRLHKLELNTTSDQLGLLTYLVTDSPQRFRRVGRLFLGKEIAIKQQVILVDYYRNQAITVSSKTRGRRGSSSPL